MPIVTLAIQSNMSYPYSVVAFPYFAVSFPYLLPGHSGMYLVVHLA